MPAVLDQRCVFSRETTILPEGDVSDVVAWSQNAGVLCSALETVGDLAPKDGVRKAWQIMRAATAGGNSYMHKWQAGDTMVWDQRRMFHARVPYDGANEDRLMWRVGWGKDVPAAAAASKL